MKSVIRIALMTIAVGAIATIKVTQAYSQETTPILDFLCDPNVNACDN